MLPTDPMHDVIDGRLCDIEPPAERTLTPPLSIEVTDIADILFSYFALRKIFAFRTPSFSSHIGIVISYSPNEKVIRVYADRVIARMTNM